jgi:hypothetical protein
MNGRANPLLLLLVVVLAGVAVWLFFPWRDRGTGGGGPADTSGASGTGSGGELLRAGGLTGVKAELFHLPYKDAYRAHLQVGFDPERYPGGKVDLPEIYEVEIRHEDMDPPLTDVESTGLLNLGWNEREVEGGYRFFTIDKPIPRDGKWAKWQFQFDMRGEPGAKTKLRAGRIRLYDRDGALIGEKALTIR